MFDWFKSVYFLMSNYHLAECEAAALISPPLPAS